MNYDFPPDREILISQTWNRETDLLIFDEIHKMNQRKSVFHPTKSWKEIDFLVTMEQNIPLLIEAKWQDSNFSP